MLDNRGVVAAGGYLHEGCLLISRLTPWMFQLLLCMTLFVRCHCCCLPSLAGLHLQQLAGTIVSSALGFAGATKQFAKFIVGGATATALDRLIIDPENRKRYTDAEVRGSVTVWHDALVFLMQTRLKQRGTMSQERAAVLWFDMLGWCLGNKVVGEARNK